MAELDKNSEFAEFGYGGLPPAPERRDAAPEPQPLAQDVAFSVAVPPAPSAATQSPADTNVTPATADPISTPPLGNDAMVATPDGQGLLTALGVQQTAAENGRSTVDERDIALMKLVVESTVKQLMAQGSSDAEIQQAISSLPYAPELAKIAQEIAQQQLDADKFNMTSTRQANGPGAGTGGPAQGHFVAEALGGIVGAAAVASAASESPAHATAETTQPEAGQAVPGVMTASAQPPAPSSPASEYGLASDARYPFIELGSTTAALAAMGNFTPQQSLPNFGPSRQAGIGA